MKQFFCCRKGKNKTGSESCAPAVTSCFQAANLSCFEPVAEEASAEVMYKKKQIDSLHLFISSRRPEFNRVMTFLWFRPPVSRGQKEGGRGAPPDWVYGQQPSQASSVPASVWTQCKLPRCTSQILAVRFRSLSGDGLVLSLRGGSTEVFCLYAHYDSPPQ